MHPSCSQAAGVLASGLVYTTTVWRHYTVLLLFQYLAQRQRPKRQFHRVQLPRQQKSLAEDPPFLAYRENFLVYSHPSKSLTEINKARPSEFRLHDLTSTTAKKTMYLEVELVIYDSMQPAFAKFSEAPRLLSIDTAREEHFRKKEKLSLS